MTLVWDQPITAVDTPENFVLRDTHGGLQNMLSDVNQTDAVTLHWTTDGDILNDDDGLTLEYEITQGQVLSDPAGIPAVAFDNFTVLEV
jgi:hypothetical protein